MNYSNYSAIVLAGGRGTRMMTDEPKVLVKLSGKPLIYWTLSKLTKLRLEEIVVVTSFKKEEIENYIQSTEFRVKFVDQGKPLGTAHAVKLGLSKLKNPNKTLILYGDDSALYKLDTIKGLLKSHIENNKPMTITSMKADGLPMIGGLERDDDNRVIDVQSYIEMKNKKLKVGEYLCGMFCIDSEWLSKKLSQVKKGKAKGEYPLPVLISMAAQENKHVNVYQINDPREWNSINTLEELQIAQEKFKSLNDN